MKNYLLILCVICLTTTLKAGAQSNGATPTSSQSQAAKSKKVTTPPSDTTKSENLGAFFDGFSVGASAGVGLFHGSLADYDIFAPLGDFSTYYKFGWRAYVQREIKWGLSAKLGFEKGKLAGGRLPGKQSIPVDFESIYNTINLSATYDILDAFTKKDGLENHKFYLNAEIGIGISFFRSVSYWRAEDGRPRDFVGYTVTDDNPPTQRYTLDAKTKPAIAFNVPVGFTFGYRLNYKTDVTFSYTLNNLSTQRLDTWDRDYASQDKYSYFGLGIRYNFNRSKSEYPKKKVKEPKDETDKKWGLFGSKKDDVKPKDVSVKTPIESRQSGKIDATMEDKELDDVKMKMFELQLKLFEMQYLLNGGDPNAPQK